MIKFVNTLGQIQHDGINTVERETPCTHEKVKCLCCGIEASPASLFGKGKKKTQSPAAIAARIANAHKGGRPRKVAPLEFDIDGSKAEAKRLAALAARAAKARVARAKAKAEKAESEIPTPIFDL